MARTENPAETGEFSRASKIVFSVGEFTLRQAQ